MRRSLLSVKNNIVRIKHDTNFNDRGKALYETFLSKLVVKDHGEYFYPVVKKVSAVFRNDFEKVYETLEKPNIISEMFLKHLRNSEDLSHLFGTIDDDKTFLSKVITALKSDDPALLYKHMAIQRAYVLFFCSKGKPEEPYDIAKEIGWCLHLNLDIYLASVKHLRAGKFDDNCRVSRLSHSKIFSGARIGIIDDETYNKLVNPRGQEALSDFPRHTKGMDLHRITSRGRFAKDGMFKYDMPQLCGPSGMVAMRFALGLQAGLSSLELKEYFFFISLFTVAVGSHTIDETFSMGTNAATKYHRGDYSSIFYPELKGHEALHRDIEKLNDTFSKILGSRACLGSDSRDAPSARL